MIRKLPDFSLENKYKKKYVSIAGIDEAGRGCLAGGVVAAAINLPNKKSLLKLGINDSKQLSKSKREELYNFLTNEFDYGIGVIDAKEIDEINILNAAKKAMQLATKSLKNEAEFLLIDGNFKISSMKDQLPVVKGDSISISIAAASIIAKVYRDNIIITEMHEKYPQYNFAKHKAYATKEHIHLIKEFGITEFHRLSFLKRILNFENEQKSIF